MSLVILARNSHYHCNHADIVNISGIRPGGAGVGVGVGVPRVSCPFIIRGRHDAVINLRDTRIYHHTRSDILLPVDDEEEDCNEEEDAGDEEGDVELAEGNTSVQADGVSDGDGDAVGVRNRSTTDPLDGLRLPNLDGSSMKFLHQVIHSRLSGR